MVSSRILVSWPVSGDSSQGQHQDTPQGQYQDARLGASVRSLVLGVSVLGRSSQCQVQVTRLRGRFRSLVQGPESSYRLMVSTRSLGIKY